MNIVNLVAHGLSAVSVFSDIAGVRMLMVAMGLGTAITSLIGLVIYIRVATSAAIPGWATNAVGLLAISLVQLCALALQFTFIIMQARSAAEFLPLRDYRLYIDEIK